MQKQGHTPYYIYIEYLAISYRIRTHEDLNFEPLSMCVSVCVCFIKTKFSF